MKSLSLIALLAVVSACPAGYSQGVGSYRRVFQKCTRTKADQTTPFSCRWMYNGIEGGTIFVDNYDTDERYTVNGRDWTTVGYVGDGKNACIKNSAGAVACLVDGN